MGNPKNWNEMSIPFIVMRLNQGIIRLRFISSSLINCCFRLHFLIKLVTILEKVRKKRGRENEPDTESERQTLRCIRVFLLLLLNNRMCFCTIAV